ncbi:hypothetical protein OAN95_00125 [Alphaproteobacteria bacterium]|nr:hypothetical protein [Alphaproteobacteria bacterium]
MNKVIKIIDYPCGSGKTTRMIENFKEDQKYLVILPLLSEVDRVIEASKGIEFVQPHANDNKHGTKTSSLEAQLLLGSNIATTHEMYERLVPMVKAGLLDDYDIIIDEVPNVVKSVASKSRTSIQEFYVDAGYMDVDAGTGLVRPTSKWRQNQEQVSGTLSPKILKYAESGCLYLQDGEMFIWALPDCILSAGNSVTVMTYKAEGSMLLAYLRKLGLPFEVSNDNHLEEDFRAKAAKLITVEDIPALSKTNFSFTGQVKGMASSSYANKIARSLKNLKERKLVGVDINNILLTSMKDAWIKAANDNNRDTEDEDETPKKNIKPGVFAKDSRMKDVNWIANTTRGTNDYMHCSHLIYLYDQNINPVVARWLGDGSRAFNDAYAHTELIQWVWRSRVRRGEPITLYLPSPRMRRLFEEWLYD